MTVSSHFCHSINRVLKILKAVAFVLIVYNIVSSFYPKECSILCFHCLRHCGDLEMIYGIDVEARKDWEHKG